MSDCLPPVVCKTLPKLAEIAVVYFSRPLLAPHSSPFFVVQPMGAHLGSELVREWRESTFYLDDWNLHRQKAMCRVRGWEQMMRWVPKIGEVYSRILYTYKWFHAEIRTCYFLLFGRQVFHCDWGGRGAQGLLSAGNSPQLKLARFDIWQILMNQLWTFYFPVHWNGSTLLGCFFFWRVFGSNFFFRP